MAKLKIAVLMGGKTPEHEISLISGREVVKNLPSSYLALPIIISRDNKTWQQVGEKAFLTIAKNFTPQRPKKEWIFLNSKKISVDQLDKIADLVFIASHGPSIEDGTIQGLLDFSGVTYTGSGVLASALGMNKIYFKRSMDHFQIPQPKSLVINKRERVSLPKINSLGKAWVVKPADQGSSVGVSIVKNKTNLLKAFSLAFKYGPRAIIEEYLSGTEVSVGILGNKKAKALPVIEICPKNEFFNYEAKYTASKCKEIVPARISKSLTKKVQDLALKVYKIIGAQGYSRVDFIIKNNIPYILEINTLPGLTPTSLVPKEAKAAGISYSQLLERIIKLALGK